MCRVADAQLLLCGGAISHDSEQSLHGIHEKN